ncbi:MAG: glutaminyl-peptide cyclotransferase [Haliea sp.]|nr:glutaminyl-peptide cyclotransferase [Haliea sp.]
MKLTRLACAALLMTISYAAASSDRFGYQVLDKKPQSRSHFVQGLQIVDGVLYVGTGGYGQSRLLQYNFADGSLLAQQHLHPRLFGEGLTVLNDRIYQLTWRAGRLLVYRKDDLKPLAVLPIPGQGWGLTHNDNDLIYSDGSHRLYFLNPDTAQRRRTVSVMEEGLPVARLNELEWVNGAVWANIWQEDRIVIIDPVSGEVTGSVDLTGLLPLEERQPATDVLNGIAYNPADGSIWVTGKNWPWMYQIELVPLPAANPDSR